jgi:SAM-dependent methyltransferase
MRWKLLSARQTREPGVDRTAYNPLSDQIDALRAELARLTSQPRSPVLWNDVDSPISANRGTIAGAVRAAAAGEVDLSGVFASVTEQFKQCVQADLIRALTSDELRGLVDGDVLPIPPPEAREWYFEDNDLAYWAYGLGDRLLLEQLGRELGRPLGLDSRLLDFGSSSGRVLRHFAVAMPSMQTFGVDLGRHNVEWARQHLHPAVTVVQGTTVPHLPFPDGYFDCIYAGSVFTHIADFEEAWLLELSRVLAPDGYAVLTFHPERIWSEIGSDPKHWVRSLIERTPHRLDPDAIEPVTLDVFLQPMPADRVVLTNMTWPVNNANVFHSERWIRERWGSLFELRSIVERAHAVYQDAAVLTPRA